MCFSHANAIFPLFLHIFTPFHGEIGEKSGKNTIQLNAGSHHNAGLTPCEKKLKMLGMRMAITMKFQIQNKKNPQKSVKACFQLFSHGVRPA